MPFQIHEDPYMHQSLLNRAVKAFMSNRVVLTHPQVLVPRMKRLQLFQFLVTSTLLWSVRALDQTPSGPCIQPLQFGF